MAKLGTGLDKKVVGLDIGSSAVRAVEMMVGPAREHPLLLAFGQVSIPRGVVVDGEVIEPEPVTDALRHLWKRGHFHKKKVHVAVSGLRAITRELDLPAMRPNELRSAARFQARELIPFHPDVTVMSVQHLGDYLDSEGEPMSHVLVAAAHRDMISGLISAIIGAGLKPVNLDLASSAMVRSVIGPEGYFADENPAAVISIGSMMTIVVVHRHKRPEFVRTIGQGGNVLTEAISSRLGVPIVDAEVLKRRIGEPFPEMVQVEAATREAVGTLINEIRGSLDYYTSLASHDHVSEILLTGSGSLLPDFGDRLSARIGVPVAYVSPLAYLDLSRLDLDEAEMAIMDPVLATSVGAALPPSHGEEQFNLLPPELASEIRRSRVKNAIIAAAAAVVVLLALLTGLRLFQIRQDQHNVASTKQANAQLQAQVVRYDDVIKTKEAIDAAQANIVGQISREITWPTVMDQLSRKIPSNVVLSSFSATSSPTSSGVQTALAQGGAFLPAPTATLATVTVAGTGPQVPGAANWITEMSSSPVFSNVFVSNISAVGASSGSAAASNPSGIQFASSFNITGSAHTTRLSEFPKAS